MKGRICVDSAVAKTEEDDMYSVLSTDDTNFGVLCQKQSGPWRPYECCGIASKKEMNAYTHSPVVQQIYYKSQQVSRQTSI